MSGPEGRSPLLFDTSQSAYWRERCRGLSRSAPAPASSLPASSLNPLTGGSGVGAGAPQGVVSTAINEASQSAFWRERCRGADGEVNFSGDVSIRLLAGEVSGPADYARLPSGWCLNPLTGGRGVGASPAPPSPSWRGLNPLTGGRGVGAHPLQAHDPKAIFGPLSNPGDFRRACAADSGRSFAISDLLFYLFPSS